MLIQMHNVGFGDHFILKEKSDILVVDFGTKTPNKYFFNCRVKEFMRFAFHHNNSTNGSFSALLTHFHEDHYIGFKNLFKMTDKKIFNKFYIPYLTYKNKKIILLELVIFYYTFIKNTNDRAYIISKDILEHIEVVTSLSKRVYCLKANDKFYLDKIKFDVLWPEKNIHDENIKFLKGFDYDKLTKLTDSIENYNDTKEKIITNMVNWFDLISKNAKENLEESDDNREYNVITENIVKNQKVLLNKLNILREQIQNNRNSFSEILSILYSNKSKFIKDINSTSIVFQNIEISDLHICNKTILKNYKGFYEYCFCNRFNFYCFNNCKYYNNQCSQNIIEELEEVAISYINEFNNKGIVMMGDVTKNIIDKKLAQVLNNNYLVLKAPHHGTETHYSHNLPHTTYNLISTKKYSNYGKISINYIDKSSKIICSNIDNCVMNNFNCNGTCP